MADNALVEKSVAERETKQSLAALHNTKLQLDESLRNLVDLNNQRQALLDEKRFVARQLEEKEVLVTQLNQSQASLKTQLDNSIKVATDETKVYLFYS